MPNCTLSSIKNVSSFSFHDGWNWSRTVIFTPVLEETVSRDGFGFWGHAGSILELNRGRGQFLIFMCSYDFITQEVYFSRLMKVCFGLIMLAGCT